MNKYEIESNDSEEDENVPENEVNPTNLADMQIQDAELSENEVFLFGYLYLKDLGLGLVPLSQLYFYTDLI